MAIDTETIDTGTIDIETIVWNGAGLVPAIAQDASTGAVLMLAWMNREALDLTCTTGQVHFWSRSRSAIWRKGATSGNTMAVTSITADCDGDTVLVSVVPAGPACHRGTTTCFDDASGSPSADATHRSATGGIAPSGIEALWRTITQRASDLPEGSYTASLIDGGVDATARKVVEEAGEVLIAAKNHAVGGDPHRVISETADLIYHMFVLLAERGLDLADVERELDARADG